MNRGQIAIEMRARKQIVDDGTGFEWTLYIDYLKFEAAKRLVPRLSHKEWKLAHDRAMHTPILDIMQRYMPFALRKAGEGKNISAQRSLLHYVAWYWLLDDEAMSRRIENYLKSEYTDRADYGIDMLYNIRADLQDKEAKR